MLKKLLDLVHFHIFLARDVQENKDKVERLRQEMDDLTDLVKSLRFEIQNVRNEERHEREKSLLKIENALLKSELQLPPAKEDKKRK